jgi:hypothetical protein
MSLYMFTSCGWFFDEISGLEPVQNLRYALRAIELSEGLAAANLREGLLGFLDLIRPNAPAYGTGRDVWRREVESGSLSPGVAAAHWAASVLLEAPLALAAFAESYFQPRALVAFKNEKIMAGVVDLNDRHLERTTSHLCLARRAGPLRLELWVADLEAGTGIPAWLNEKAAPSDIPEGREIVGAAGYGWLDLLPGARRQLVRALVKQALAEFRDQAEEFNQLIQPPAESFAPSADWADGFIQQAAAEAIFGRLLSPGLDQLDFRALAEFVGQGWPRFQAALRESGETFLVEAGRALDAGPSRPVLDGLVRFLKIIPEGLDLWALQNHWWEAAEKTGFPLDGEGEAGGEVEGLAEEEKELMRELGLLLGFALERSPETS